MNGRVRKDTDGARGGHDDKCIVTSYNTSANFHKIVVFITLSLLTHLNVLVADAATRRTGHIDAGRAQLDAHLNDTAATSRQLGARLTVMIEHGEV